MVWAETQASTSPQRSSSQAAKSTGSSGTSDERHVHVRTRNGLSRNGIAAQIERIVDRCPKPACATTMTSASGRAWRAAHAPRVFGGRTLTRDPVYAVQGHAIYQTRWGVWAALDTTYYAGGRPTIDGTTGERQEHLRMGGTIAIPVDRRNSVKLYGSTGTIRRAEGNFDAVGIAWQYRWGAGL